MTRAEARRRAVEAAAIELCWSGFSDGTRVAKSAKAYWRTLPEPTRQAYRREAGIVVDTAERAMADAGWRMVRVVDAIKVPDMVTVPKNLTAGGMAHISAVGWNACRAAMLEDGE